MEIRSNKAQASQARIAYAIVAFVAFSFFLPTLWLPLGRDQGIGLYIADVLLHGGAPYRDAWEIRPPGIFYFYALGISLFGKNDLALRLLDAFLQMASALALCALCRRMYGTVAGVAAGVLYPLTYVLGHDFWNLGNTDSAVALPSILAMLAVLPKKRGPRWLWDMASGSLMGVVFLVRFTQGLIFLPVMVLLFAAGAQTKPYCFWAGFRRFLFVCGGFLLLLLAFVFHMVAKGAWNDFFYTLFVFAPKYAVLTYAGGLADFLQSAVNVHLQFFLKYSIVTFPALAATLLILIRRRTAAGFAGLAWLFATLVSVNIMAKFYAYHWLPIFAPLAFLSGAGAAYVADRSTSKAWRATIAASLIVGVLLFGVRFGPKVVKRVENAAALASGGLSWAEHLRAFDSIPRGGDFSATANYLSAEHIKRRTKPGDPVFIWGFETLIYYLADRNPPTRFCSNYPIVAKWHRQDWYDELVAALRKTPPIYVLLVTKDAMPWITGHGKDSMRALDGLDELRSFFLDNYEVENTIENIHILRLIKTQ